MQYYRPYKADGIIYSLDMIRLNFDLGDNLKSFEKYIQKLSDYDLRYDIKYYPNFGNFRYRHLWIVSSPIDDNCSLSIGLDFGSTSDSRSKGFIEFNPNKCMNSQILREFIKTFSLKCVTRDLVRYDLAIDIPVERGLVSLGRKGRTGYQYIDSGNGVTEYLGMRSHSGFVKLYDKTKESNLDYALTRLELTLDRGVHIADKFPVVRICDAQDNLLLDPDLDSTDIVLIQLLRSCDCKQMYLSQLGYRRKKKLEPYLADRVLNLDNKLAMSVYNDALSYERIIT